MPARPPHAGEIAAQKARSLLELGPSEPVQDIVSLIEDRIGVPVFLTPLPGEIAGLASRLNGRWYVIGDTAHPAAGRLRFTLAHELGHVLMGHEPSIDDEKTLGPTAGDANEVAANYFAAELLLPRWLVEDRFGESEDPDDVDGCLDLVFELASLSGTTPWVPLIRLDTLELISRPHSSIVKAAIGPALNEGRFPAPLDDVAERFAGTSATRMPDDHEERTRRLDELAGDDDGP